MTMQGTTNYLKVGFTPCELNQSFVTGGLK